MRRILSLLLQPFVYLQVLTIKMAPSLNQASTTPTMTNPDLRLTLESPHNLPLTPTLNNHSPTPSPPTLRTGDGNAGTTLERAISRAHSRRDSKLCSHSSPPTGCNAMESNDANAESPTKARPTPPLPPLSQPPVPCSGPQDQPPLSHPDKTFPSSTG